jgi:predicted RNase H-like HicB family nuclease
MPTEIVFEVREDEADGGFTAAALGHDIFTQADTLPELRANLRDAVQCHFGDGAAGDAPSMIRLHFGLDEHARA